MASWPRRPAVLLAALALVACTGCQRFQARVELRRGNELYRNESYDAAVVAFRKGLALDPEATFAWRSLAFAALAGYRPGDGDPENRRRAAIAVDAFRRYLAAHPGDVRARELYLETLLAAGRHDEALREIGRLLALDPEDEWLKRSRERLQELAAERRPGAGAVPVARLPREG